MSTFDVNEYFKNVANTVTPVNIYGVDSNAVPENAPSAFPVVQPIQIYKADPYVNEKANNLVRAVEEKAARLEQRRIASQNSLVTRLDLNPYGDAAALTNAAVAPLQGAARVGLDLLELPGRGLTAGLEATGLYDYDQANRARANLKTLKESLMPDLIDQRARGEFSDALATAPGTEQALAGISKNIEDLPFDQDTFNNLSTLAKNAFASAQDNKGAFFSYLAENAPQIALAVAAPVKSLAATAGYAAEAYDNWNLEYVNKYKKEPTAQEKQEAAIKAVGLFASEGAADLITGGVIRGTKIAAKPLVDASKAVAGALKPAASVSTETFKKSLLGSVVKAGTGVADSALRIAGSGAMGAVPEAITEGIQTKLEADLALQPATAQDIYEGAAIGGLAGGSFTGSAKGIQELKSIPDAKDRGEDFKQKVKTGDTTAELSGKDAASKKWSDAADIVTLNALENKDVDKVNSLARLDNEVATPLTAELEKAKESVKETAVAKYSNLVKETEAKIALVTDPAIKQDLEEQLTDFQIKLTKAEEIQPDSKAEKLVKQLEEELVAVQLSKAVLQQEAVGSLTEDNFVNELKTLVADSKEVPSKKLVAYFANSSGFGDKAINAIKQAIADPATAPETVKQLRVFADYIIELNKAKNTDVVSTQVTQGTVRKEGKQTPLVDFKGAIQYQAAFEEAVRNNNQEAAIRELSGLIKFNERIKEKSAAIAQLATLPKHIAEFNKTTKKWEVRPLKKEELTKEWLDNSRKAGSINTAFNTAGVKKLSDQINSDAAAIGSLLNGMNQLASLSGFNPVSTIQSTNVQEATQTKQTSQEGSKVSGTAEASTGTQQTSVRATETQIGEQNGLQKQRQETAQEVNVETLVDLAEKEGLVDEIVSEIETEINNATEISESPTGRAEAGNAEQNQQISNTQSQEAVVSQESDSNTGNNRPSSETVSAESTAEAASNDVDFVTALGLSDTPRQRIIELRKYIEALTALSQACK